MDGVVVNAGDIARAGTGRICRAPATFVDHMRPDGSVVRWESRRHRKHQQPATGSAWWAPTARGWWIAILFAIGSLLFALGSVPAYAGAAGARWDTVTYFAGSVFFTTAAFLSYREAVDAAPPGRNPAHRRFFTWQPGRIDWWATAVQFAGTLYFNVSTGIAMAHGLPAHAAHRYVWRPDMIGSACFLASSGLAWYEACHGWAAWRPRSWSWWITLVNLAGSVAFGISAVAGWINPVTGEVHNAARANLQTLIGAVCFLIGAVLLLPERTEETRPAGDRPVPGRPPRGRTSRRRAGPVTSPGVITSGAGSGLHPRGAGLAPASRSMRAGWRYGHQCDGVRRS